MRLTCFAQGNNRRLIGFGSTPHIQTLANYQTNVHAPITAPRRHSLMSLSIGTSTIITKNFLDKPLANTANRNETPIRLLYHYLADPCPIQQTVTERHGLQFEVSTTIVKQSPHWNQFNISISHITALIPTREDVLYGPTARI